MLATLTRIVRLSRSEKRWQGTCAGVAPIGAQGFDSRPTYLNSLEHKGAPGG